MIKFIVERNNEKHVGEVLMNPTFINVNDGELDYTSFGLQFKSAAVDALMNVVPKSLEGDYNRYLLSRGLNPKDECDSYLDEYLMSKNDEELLGYLMSNDISYEIIKDIKIEIE